MYTHTHTYIYIKKNDIVYSNSVTKQDRPISSLVTSRTQSSCTQSIDPRGLYEH